jgi:ribosomal protein S6E (S10)
MPPLKKVNIYSATQLEVLKKELIGVVDYLQQMDLMKIADIVDWKPTRTGGLMPSVISTEEKIIKTAISVIKNSATMITAVYESEGMSEMLGYQIGVTIDKLKEFQDFYFGKSLLDIEDRKLEIPMGKDKQGKPKTMKIVVASKEDQIIARGQITESVSKLIPMIDVIKGYKGNVARGGVEKTPAMIRFEKRKAAGLMNS